VSPSCNGIPSSPKCFGPSCKEHYEIETNVPVGDAPRPADIVLIRRTSDRPPPFRGLLRNLTTWNIIEFKGRTVSARIRDLDLLVELGLGLDRRLNEERVRQKQRPLDEAEVSFWYIANHLGRRFLREAGARLGSIEEAAPEVWRSQLLLRPIFLIDGRTVPVDRESVPLHLVGEESQEIDEALAHVIVEEPGYWELYGSLLGVLHPNIIDEANQMATTKGKRDGWDLRPFIAKVGVKKYLEAVELRELIDAFGAKKVVKELGVERILANLSTEDRQKLKDRLK
jgi:hypothetical protein